MGRLTRRELLVRAAAAGPSLALVPSIFGGCSRAFGPGATGGSALGPIRHVVIFLQENRSFDHYFGTLAGVRGFGDPHPQYLPDGARVFSQPSASGRVGPMRLDRTRTSGQCVADVDHGWGSGHDAWNGGRMDRWVPAKGPNAMGYHAREDLPFHHALADAFTVCDHYFCSTNTSTNPNRLFAMTGSNDGEARFQGPVVDNDTRRPFTWTTYAERLEAAGIGWRVYQGPDNFDDNALAWFEAFQNAEAGEPLFDKGMARTLEDAFLADVESDALPAVSWIVASTANSEHPAEPPNAGAALLERYVRALMAKPEVFEKTLFIYSMDENGGFFDHVLPPLPPVGEPGERLAGKPMGMGHRVPLIAVSPYTAGGRVCSEVFDHTSLLRLLERFTGVEEPNIGEWRRRLCGDLVALLDFTKPARMISPTLPDAAALASEAREACRTMPAAQPNGDQLPAQESASRTLLPLPYAPEAVLEVDPAQLRIRLKNGGTRTAPFSVHRYGPTFDTPVAADIAPGGEEVVAFDTAEGGRHDFAVLGVNGFYRRFIGNTADAITTRLLTTSELALLQVTNAGSSARTLQFVDVYADTKQAFVIEPGTTRSLSLRLLGRWYEGALLLDAESATRFVRLYAGHLEGQEDRTLPLEVVRDPALDPPPTA